MNKLSALHLFNSALSPLIFMGLWLGMGFYSFAQGDAVSIINNVNSKFRTVKDYKASAIIKTDIPFIKMFPVKADIYFKQPGKIHIDSKGIAILPKQTNSIMLDVLKDTGSYMAISAGVATVNNLVTQIIKVLPLSDTSDLVLGTFYIEPKTALVHKAQLTTRSRGTVDVLMKYGKFASFGLPDTLVFEMDVNKFKIPKAIAADLENTTKKTDDKKSRKGKVTITYTNYVINKGIDDKIFTVTQNGEN